MNHKQQKLWDKYQQCLEDLSNMQIHIRLITSFIQNDFDYMLQEGHVNKEEVQASIPEFYKACMGVNQKISEIKMKLDKVNIETMQFLKEI